MIRYGPYVLRGLRGKEMSDVLSKTVDYSLSMLIGDIGLGEIGQSILHGIGVPIKGPM